METAFTSAVALTVPESRVCACPMLPVTSVTAPKMASIPACCWSTAAAMSRTTSRVRATLFDSSRKVSPEVLTWTRPVSIRRAPCSVKLTAARIALPSEPRTSRTRDVARID